jgi:sugar transferase (PEP-CTERM/EpsH1 system associated)
VSVAVGALARSGRDALVVAHRLPFPPDKGDKIRSFHLLEHLRARGWRVHLGCLVDDPADLAHVDALRRRWADVHAVPIAPRRRKALALRGLLDGRPLTFPYFADRGLARWVAATRARIAPALALATSSGVAPYLAAGAPGMLRVVDLVDLDSEKWRLYAAAGGPLRWLQAREARTLAAAEVAIARGMDATLLVSEAEAADLRARPGVPGGRVHVVANGVDLAAFDPALPFPHPTGAAGPALVFTGAMDYRPNVDAVAWLAEAVWPRLAAARPELALWVVGARPDPRILALGRRPGIVVTGRVPDVRPWLAHGTLAVAPLRLARGLQNKVLEAMAMAKAVVASPAATAGLDAETRACLAVADGAGATAEAIATLLDDAAGRAALGERARRHALAAWSWPARLAALDALVERAGPALRDAA